MTEFVALFVSAGLTAQEAQIVIILGLAMFIIFALRCLVASLYKSQLRLVKKGFKESYKGKEDAEKNPSPFFKRAAKDYITLGEA
ncbi:MAG: hypothetical protein LBS19_05980, partial [Clostridiales bacterium]|nr:hypothetical protein [Clostridiales bacterium]